MPAHSNSDRLVKLRHQNKLFKTLHVIVIVLSLFFAHNVFSQAGYFLSCDSLKKLLDTETKEDTTRADRLLSLSACYVYDKPDSGIYYAAKALQLSEKLGYKHCGGKANVHLGEAYWVLGDYAMSMQYYLRALNVFQQMKSTIDLSSIKYFIADIYTEMNDYKQALQYYFEARKIDEENPEEQAFEGFEIDFDVMARLAVADEQAGEEGAERNRQSCEPGRDRERHQDQQRDRHDQVAAAGAHGRTQQWPNEESAEDHDRNHRRKCAGERADQRQDAAMYAGVLAAGQDADHEQNRHYHHVLE